MNNRAKDVKTQAEACYRAAREAAERGGIEESIHHLEETVRRRRFHREANANLAWLYSQRGEYRRALPRFVRLLIAKPWGAEAHARAMQCAWFAWRRLWRRAAGRSRLLNSIHRAMEAAAALVSEGMVSVLERVAGRPRLVSGWARHNRRLAAAFAVNPYEYYKVSEIAFVAERIFAARPDRVLDLGSGRSAFPSFLAAHGFEVTVCELDRGPLGLQRDIAARAWGGNPAAVAGDFLRLPFKNGCFGAVSIISTIEHVPGEGDIHAIRELARALAPGGDLLITVPAGPVYQEQWTRNAIGHVYQESADHGGAEGFLRVYTLEALKERLIQPSGLRAESAICVGETTRWGWLGLGRNFIDRDGRTQPSAFAAPLNRMFAREIPWDRIGQAHWAVACIHLVKDA